MLCTMTVVRAPKLSDALRFGSSSGLPTTFSHASVDEDPVGPSSAKGFATTAARSFLNSVIASALDVDALHCARAPPPCSWGSSPLSNVSKDVWGRRCSSRCDALWSISSNPQALDGLPHGCHDTSSLKCLPKPSATQEGELARIWRSIVLASIRLACSRRDALSSNGYGPLLQNLRMSIPNTTDACPSAQRLLERPLNIHQHTCAT